jgi:enoyl-CoA hydratase/carnithine racemase
MQRAAEWVYTGRMLTADDVVAGGLARSAHGPDELLPAAYALAREIADNSAPVSVALSRQMMWRMLTADHPMQAHRADSRGINARGASLDAAEGVSSFLEKRPAVFPNTVTHDFPNVFPDWIEPEFS